MLFEAGSRSYRSRAFLLEPMPAPHKFTLYHNRHDFRAGYCICLPPFTTMHWQLRKAQNLRQVRPATPFTCMAFFTDPKY